MNVSYFIGISSAVLLTWLGFTYFQQVPHDRYPKQKRHTTDTSAITPVEINEAFSAAVTIIE